jgi:hypothetical protein
MNVSETVGIEKIFNQHDDATKALKQEILPGVTVNMVYVGFAKCIVIIINQSVSFPSESDNYDFTNVKFFLAYASYHTCIESVSDCSRVQSLADLTAQKNLMSTKRGL